MEEGPNRSDSGAFSDLEQTFFEAAPPDVPVPPPEPMRFDDLEPDQLGVRFRNARARGGAAARSLSRLVGTGGRRFVLAPALRTRRRTAQLAAIGWRRLLPRVRAAREATGRGIDVAVARLAAELPTERPDRKTIVAAMVVLILVMSLSAGVVASRGGAWTTLRTPTAGTRAGEGGAAVAEARLVEPAQCPVTTPVAPAAAVTPPARTAPRPRSHHVSKNVAHQRKLAVVPAGRVGQSKPVPAPARGNVRPTANARKPTFAR